MTRTIAEINEKIRKGQAVVATAEEVIGIVEKKGIEKAPHRSLMKAVGLTDEEIARPLVGVANSWNEIVPGHTHLRDIVDAVKAGVRHVVYTSMPQPENSPLLIAPDHDGTEKALQASTLAGWTVLRNHWYFENLFMFMASALASGQWYTADGGQGSADISRDDLARAAATVLAGSETGKHTYTLSGREALTKADIARRVSAATGRPVEVVQVPLEGLVQGMVAAGLPEPLARVFASFDSNTAAGRVAEVTGDYQRITGELPQSFDAWLAAHRSGFSGGH